MREQRCLADKCYGKAAEQQGRALGESAIPVDGMPLARSPPVTLSAGFRNVKPGAGRSASTKLPFLNKALDRQHDILARSGQVRAAATSL